MFKLLCVLVLTVAFAPSARAGMFSAEALQAIDGAVRAQQEVQSQVEAWDREKEELLSKIRNLKNQLRYLHHQQEKFASYSLRQEASIRRMETRQQELERVQVELEPFLVRVVQRLKTFVRHDLPFLREEREKRLAFLQETLDDYRLPVSEKFRRVMEALQVEADYGKYAEVSESFIDLDGKESKVFVLRLGRVALFYLTPDAQKAGRYDRSTGQWVELSGATAAALKSAVQMVGKNRAMELVNLPVAR